MYKLEKSMKVDVIDDDDDAESNDAEGNDAETNDLLVYVQILRNTRVKCLVMRILKCLRFCTLGIHSSSKRR